MKLSTNAQKVYKKIAKEDAKMGDLKKLAKQIKKDHDLAMELWSTKEYLPRLFSALIMDNKLLTQEVIERLMKDLEKQQSEDEQNRVSEWLLGNQFTKDKDIIELMLTWEKHKLPLLRRLFWYYQARLRWTGKIDHDNTEELVKKLEKGFAKEVPQVQWTMNFCGAWIGTHDKKFRKRCVDLGKKVGLYKDEKMVKGCTPNYMPEFIRIEAAKAGK